MISFQKILFFKEDKFMKTSEMKIAIPEVEEECISTEMKENNKLPKNQIDPLAVMCESAGILPDRSLVEFYTVYSSEGLGCLVDYATINDPHTPMPPIKIERDLWS